MHDLIFATISESAYHDRLLSADLQWLNPRKTAVRHRHWALGPVSFVMTQSHHEKVGLSVANKGVANVAVQLIVALDAIASAHDLPAPVSVQIISAYRGQLQCVKDKPSQRFLRGPEGWLVGSLVVNVSTDDSFQGQEADVVVVSTTRHSTPTSSPGFLDDLARANVALSRARKSLVILGDPVILRRLPAWSTALHSAEGYGRLESPSQVQATSAVSRGAVAQQAMCWTRFGWQEGAFSGRNGWGLMASSGCKTRRVWHGLRRSVVGRRSHHCVPSM